MRKIFTFFLAIQVALLSQAQPFVRWTFDASNTVPVLGSGTISDFGGISTTYAGGFPNSQSNTNFGLNSTGYPASASGAAGVIFSVSTADKTGIVVSWYHRHSNSSSRWGQIQYSTDGTNFVTADLTAENFTNVALGTSANQATALIDLAADAFGGTAGDGWYGRTLRLTGITTVENNPNFKFRIVPIHAPGTGSFLATQSTYATTGTWRYDSVVVGSNNTLPLKLGAFNASRFLNTVKLAWNTNNEANIDAFGIEKSTNGQQFSPLASIKGRNAATASYSFTDNQPINGKNYYRLQIKEKDGLATYSKTVVVNFEPQSVTVEKLYPTLTQNRVQLDIGASKSQLLEVLVLNNAGQMVLRQRHQASAGNSQISLSLGTLSAAKYTVQVLAEGVPVFTSSVVKQ